MGTHDAEGRDGAVDRSGLLALVFLFAGGMKLVMPLEELTKGAPVQLPGLFLRFIGVCEVLGAIGLIVRGSYAFVPS
jgi:hypothetical protein